MGAMDLFFITISHSVSFMGHTWWISMLLLRLLLLLLAGFTLFGDEQESFVCNTLQPGCSNVCFDVFAPVSVLRLWLLHLLLLSLPHLLFASYVMHRVLSCPEGFCCDRSLERSRSSGELSLHKAPLQVRPREWEVPRFYCSYFLVVILRILLELVFGVGQFFLFGLSIPKSFLCHEAPCTSGVECYISRPTEKTLMLNFMLGVAALSVLLSLGDLVSSTKAMVTWRSKREMLMEDLSKGEQASMFTTTTTTEDSEVLLTRKISLSGSSKNDAAAVPPNAEAPPTKGNGGSKTRTDVLHNHPRPPVSPRPDGGGPPPGPRVPLPVGVRRPGQCPPAGANSSQQSESSEAPDKRAWV